MAMDESGRAQRNLLLRLQYDGSAYHGWQVQKNAPTIQSVLQDALGRVFGGHPDVTGCSRTDAFVHANDYACNFRTYSDIPCESIVRALNANLPYDIAVKSCEQADPAFHARYCCSGKEYIYKILNREVRDPFLNRYALHYPHRLELDKMNLAAQAFLGKHDFSAFRASGGAAGDAVRCVTCCCFGEQDSLVIFRVPHNFIPANNPSML